MNKIKISVIIPVYNVEKYLPECLDSIVNQTLKDIEVICINDGSTDDSLKILEKYAEKDDRIKIINRKNCGQTYTRKIGLDNAVGKYILFCDSDDYYSELTAFEELYNYIEKVKVDVVIFNHYRENKAKGYLEKRFDKYPKKTKFSYLDIDNIFSFHVTVWIKLYSKQFLDKYDDWFFPKEHFVHQDMPLHFQIVTRANLAYFEKYFYTYRIRPRSTITIGTTDKKLLDFCKIFEAIYKITKDKCKVVQYLNYFYSNLATRIYNYQIKDVKIVEEIIKIIKHFTLSELFLLEKKEVFFILRAGLRMTPESYMEYLDKKQIKGKIKEIKKLEVQIKSKNEAITIRDNKIKKQDLELNQKNSEIQNLHNQNNDLRNQNNIKEQVIKRLLNSWSYRIGRLFTYPLSIPLEFFKFIRDYNLIKKSDLFDSEYYLLQNEDVKNAKMNPIKHYLKFGWKEGRNPSVKFDGNEYLNKRSDVRVAGICPLVHYLKFGKNEK